MLIRTSMMALAALGGVALAACGSDTGSSSSSSASGGGQSSSASSSLTYSCTTGSVKASGSTALQPLADQAGKAYAAKCPGATITVGGGGSSQGIKDVAGGQSDIGDSDVPASNVQGLDVSSLKDNQVAVVPFAIVVNPSANVSNLSTKQIQDIFSGKVTNYKDVGGADLAVTVVLRKTGSGTRLTFDKTIMQGTAETGNAAQDDSTNVVLQQVSQTPGGITYAAAGSAQSNAAVKVAKIDNVAPSQDTVSGGSYKFYAHEHMYTGASPSALATNYINFVQSSDFASALKAAGFYPGGSAGPSAADQ